GGSICTNRASPQATNAKAPSSKIRRAVPPSVPMPAPPIPHLPLKRPTRVGHRRREQHRSATRNRPVSARAVRGAALPTTRRVGQLPRRPLVDYVQGPEAPRVGNAATRARNTLGV